MDSDGMTRMRLGWHAIQHFVPNHIIRKYILSFAPSSAGRPEDSRLVRGIAGPDGKFVGARNASDHPLRKQASIEGH